MALNVSSSTAKSQATLQKAGLEGRPAHATEAKAATQQCGCSGNRALVQCFVDERGRGGRGAYSSLQHHSRESRSKEKGLVPIFLPQSR